MRKLKKNYSNWRTCLKEADMDSSSMHLLEIAMWASVAALVVPTIIAGVNYFYNESHHHI